MLLGLTGGIATGKTTFRHCLVEAHTFDVFDADACVHELLDGDRSVITSIVDAFGSAALTPAGLADKAFLRTRIYSEPAARRTLEEILHPRVRQRWQELAAISRDQGRDFLADIPLLFETGAQEAFDAVVMVAASPATQQARLRGRGQDADLIERMLASQWSIDEKMRLADHVIWNDGAPEALRRQAADLLATLFPSGS
jgi:dephospho-CoA kinase